MTFSGSVTYLKLMKAKGLGELCAATSELTSLTDTEKKTHTQKTTTNKQKTDLLIIHKPNMTSSHFKTHINGTVAIISHICISFTTH